MRIDLRFKTFIEDERGSLLFVTFLKISLTGFYMVALEQKLKISYF